MIFDNASRGLGPLFRIWGGEAMWDVASVTLCMYFFCSALARSTSHTPTAGGLEHFGLRQALRMKGCFTLQVGKVARHSTAAAAAALSTQVRLEGVSITAIPCRNGTDRFRTILME